MAKLKISSDLQTIIKEVVLDTYFPIGSIYISTNSTSPATLFGGTWKQCSKGRFLLGEGSPEENNDSNFGDLNNNGYIFKSGRTGGQYNHILTVDEIPRHNHLIHFPFYRFSEMNSGYHGNVYKGDLVQDSYHYSEETGGGLKHNNMPPYYTVYMWERTK